MKSLPRWVPALFLLSTGFAFVILFKFFGGDTAPRNIGKEQAALSNYGSIAPFSLSDHNAQPFTHKNLQGKLWIADFIFTRCTGMCPILSSRMRDLQKIFEKNDSNIHLVSFSVDPEWDTPQRLLAYAQRFDVNTSSWSFVTGPRRDLENLILKNFKLAMAVMSEDEAQGMGEAAGSNQRITHSDRLVLVDKNMHIRGYYHGTDALSIKLILRDLKRLRNEN